MVAAGFGPAERPGRERGPLVDQLALARRHERRGGCMRRGLHARSRARSRPRRACRLAGRGRGRQAQKPAAVGDGVKTGQLSVQMFNYGGYISTVAARGGQPRHRGLRRCRRPPPSTPPACRAERLERAVRVPAVQGRHRHRAVRPCGLPGRQRHRGPHGVPRADGQVPPARRRLARQHERGELGRARQRREDPRRRLHRLRRRRRSRHQHLRRDAGERQGAQPARQAVRRGRRRPGVHPQPHGRVRPQVRRRTAC